MPLAINVASGLRLSSAKAVCGFEGKRQKKEDVWPIKYISID